MRVSCCFQDANLRFVDVVLEDLHSQNPLWEPGACCHGLAAESAARHSESAAEAPAMSPCRHVAMSWFLVLDSDGVTLILVGDRPVRNLSKGYALYSFYILRSKEQRDKDFLTLHLGVTCFCCDGFLQNLHSHSVKANACGHDAAWDAGNRTSPAGCPIALCALQDTWINIRKNMVVS